MALSGVLDWSKQKLTLALAFCSLIVLAAPLSPILWFQQGSAPLFWLPSGVALGVLLRHGTGFLPFLWVGLSGAYAWVGEGFIWAMGMGCLDTLIILALGLCMDRLGFDLNNPHKQNGWITLGIGVVLGSLLHFWGAYLMFGPFPSGFIAPFQSLLLGFLVGALPVLTFSRQEFRCDNLSQFLVSWGGGWAVPVLLMGFLTVALDHLAYLPGPLLPYLGLLWMIWFVWHMGLACASLALLLTALLEGWLLYLQPDIQPMQLEISWGLLMIEGGLICAVSPLLGELRERDYRVLSALEETRSGIWEWDLRQDKIVLTPSWLLQLGYEERGSGLTMREWEAMLHMGDVLSFRESLVLHLNKGDTLFRHEFRWLKKPDGASWVIVRGRVVERDGLGQPLRMVGTLVDISAQKAVQQHLQLVKRALQATGDGVLIADLGQAGQPLLFFNDALARVLGVAPDSLTTCSFSSLISDLLPDADSMIQHALARDVPAWGMFSLRLGNGALRWVYLSVSQVPEDQGRANYCVALVKDVSAEVSNQEHLRERDALLKKLSEQVPGVIFQYMSPEHGTAHFPYCSEGLRDLFGLDASKLQETAEPFFDTLHPADREHIRSSLNRRQGNPSPWRSEFRILTADGEGWRDGQAVPEVLGNGDVLWHGYIKDITAQVQLVRALGESEARFRAIANATPMLVWQAGMSGEALWFNQAWFDFVGESAQLGRQPWIELVHPEERQNIEALVLRHVKKQQPFRVECRIKHQEHGWRWVINHGVPWDIPGQGDMGYIGACMDIDEQKRVELALRQSREELRQMALREERVLEQERKRIASQVHDELGQILTAIKMGFSAMKLRYGKVDGLAQQVSSLNELSAKAFRVVRQVTSYLRPQTLNLGLRPALEWLAKATSESTGLPVRVHCPDIICQPNDAITTALFRLAQEGVTNILRHAQASEAEILLSCSGGCLMLSVRDDGIGLQTDVKGGHQGYGLLGMRERAEQLGGVFHIISKPDEGTELQLFIPMEQRNDCFACPCCR